MNATSFTSMIENLSQSLLPVQALVSGAGYFLGIIFFMIGIRKLKSIADFRARSSSQIPMIVPIAYFLGGAALIYLPQILKAASTTVFGSGNILAYSSYSTFSVQGAMILLIQTAGVIWFVRGTVLIVNASNPGIQHGAKGLTFLVAGILALNFETTASVVYETIEWVASNTLAFKGKMGY